MCFDKGYCLYYLAVSRGGIVANGDASNRVTKPLTHIRYDRKVISSKL